MDTNVVAGHNSTTTITGTSPWSSQTNWAVSSGSLHSTVTVESFDFPIDSQSTPPKPPLLLLPRSSPDFQSCEIKLNFTRKHEIRQVYIRSTARVYEIYYAPALQSENEYLCTVRCSAASVEDNLFPETYVKEAASVNLVGVNGILPKGRVAGENYIGSNEDDWVEIKFPVGRVDDGNTCLPNQTSNVRSYQDYYEATAEINDSEPCMSLTLRLLSLQSKGCVYVDEVYVFADPISIDMNESENQTVNAESSAGSALMTMLVPTLLGLSKSRSVQLDAQHSFKSVGKPLETESGPATSTNPVNLAIQQDEKLLEQSKGKAELSQFQGPVPASAFVPDKVELCDMTRNTFSYNRAESLLEQLVSRVTRIEDICMRFEENMLKPINSMEARLQHVEQQVELLAKNSSCCPRFQPNPRSISCDGSDVRPCGEPESEKETNEPTEDTSVAVSSQFHEGVMASAPESLHCDAKQLVNDVLESPKKEKPKKSVSINDALAAALAGFSSFTIADDRISLAVVPLQSPEEECLERNKAPIDTTLGSNSNGEASSFSGSLEVTAPVEENDNNSSEYLEVTADGEEINGDDRVTSPTLNSSMVDALYSTGDTTATSCDASTEIADDSFRLQRASEEATSPTASFSSSLPHENYKTDTQLVKRDSKIPKFDKADILKYFPHQSPEVAYSPNSGQVKDGCILEVRFTPSESGSLKSGLESLLSSTDDPATDEGEGEGALLLHVEEKTNLLVDLDGDDVREAVLQDLPPVQPFASLI